MTGVQTCALPICDEIPEALELARSSDAEKQDQIARLRAFQQAHADTCEGALEQLRQTALAGGNIFGELMHTVRHASLGQITDALFEVGGKYRRNV